MNSKLKISIRFFNDREVRAIWDEQHTKWWFSVLDIVGILNEEIDYDKVRNYWKYLKAKLKKENQVGYKDRWFLSLSSSHTTVHTGLLHGYLWPMIKTETLIRDLYPRVVEHA